MIIDNAILVGIVLSLMLSCGICLFIFNEDDGFDAPKGRFIFSMFIIALIFWVIGFLIYWPLKFIFN